MNLINFITSLLPRMSKDTVLEDLRITKGELQSGLVPMYDAAAKFFVANKLKAEANTDLSTVFYRNYTSTGGKKQPNFISEIDARLLDVVANLTFVEEQLEDLLEHDIIVDGLTAKKALLIRAAEHLSFISTYGADLLNYIYVMEAVADKNGSDEETFRLSPAQVTTVTKGISNFARILSIYGRPEKVFKEQLSETPDVIFNEKTAASLSAVYKENKLDPYSTLMVAGFSGSPIYHVRLLIAEWQANRYKAFKDKKRMLELRLLHLKLIQEKTNDPKLETEINYLQNRIDSIEYKMQKMES